MTGGPESSRSYASEKPSIGAERGTGPEASATLRPVLTKRRLVTALLVTVVALAVPQAASAAACDPVRNPYPGTRFEGVDLTRIRATEVSCSTARRVARRAHRKALGLTPTPDGMRRFMWRHWRVGGDLRPAKDRYVARRGDRVVRWRF